MPGAQVLQLVAELVVSDATVKAHVARLLADWACATGSGPWCSPTSPGLVRPGIR
jgi:hypothetical protein